MKTVNAFPRREQKMGAGRVVSITSSSSRSRRFARPPPSFSKKSSPKNQIKKNVSDLIACDLLGIAKTLKRSNVSCLSLYQKYGSLQKRKAENRKLGFLGYRHSETLFTFSRALSWGLSGGGWLQELELGFALWERDLKIIAEALSQSTTLKRLSFANSEFGDHSLQILGRSLQECAQLEILNLSACSLTNGVAPLLSNILKAHVCRKAQADWQASLRSSKGINALTVRPKGLIGLDVSLNQLSDLTVQTMCGVFRCGTPLEALNLRANQLTRLSGKLLLDVMEEWGILRFVDLRDNVDNKLMGVLEDGQHLTSFSRVQSPFWLSSPALRSRRACYKSSIRKYQDENVFDNIKPMEEIFKNHKKKRSSRPQSAPSAVPPAKNQARGYGRSSLLASEGTNRRTDIRKNEPQTRALDMKSALQPQKRPSTSPEKSQSHNAQQHLLSSCSTSPEFAAWDYDNTNSKENRLPLKMDKLNAVLPERGAARENSELKNLPRKCATRFQQGVSVLRQMDMTTTNSLKENKNFTNHRSSEGAKPASQKLKQLKPQTESMPMRYKSQTSGLQSQAKEDVENDSQKMLPTPPSRSAVQTTEWNSFLKEITQAIFHLQERLDELIGPADPDSLTEQAASQLQVLC